MYRRSRYPHVETHKEWGNIFTHDIASAQGSCAINGLRWHTDCLSNGVAVVFRRFYETREQPFGGLVFPGSCTADVRARSPKPACSRTTVWHFGASIDRVVATSET